MDKPAPGKLKESDLAAFEKKCDTLSQECDTLDLILKRSVEVMTDVTGDISTSGNN